MQKYLGHVARTLALATAIGSFASLSARAQETGAALTIYNQNFAVVRETLPLDLKPGENRVTFTGATAHLEPDSVILRDPTGKRTLRILEQNYEAEPISQELLLSRFEGQTIDFMSGDKIIKGRIIRSGYVPHANGIRRYGNQYAAGQYAMAYGNAGQPIIEVEGKLRFTLPGMPLFPSLGDDTILKPTLSWTLDADKPGPLTAELAYISGGMTWEADYNVVSPEQGDLLEISGFVTIDNQSGKDFANARIKLMAGDVSKLQPNGGVTMGYPDGTYGGKAEDAARPVSEKTFDEYHLYTLNRTTTLKDRETKQVEFIRASGIASQRIYVYDGVRIDYNQYRGWNYESVRNQRDYGTQSNPKIWVMREFRNTKENHLGIPLPKGRVRFYRQDNATGGAPEFVGENLIDHTPQNELVRIYTGDAFDVVGERRQTNYFIDTSKRVVDESFEIKLRNRKKEPVTVRVVEHLYRGLNWAIVSASQDSTKKDSRTVEFSVTIPPDTEKTLTYTAHYTW